MTPHRRRNRPAIWIDAFADRPFAGNPCLVVFDADDIPVETRIALVRETNLSECAYVVGSNAADFGARYYTAADEIKMAGHPTIATAAALIERGMAQPGAAFTLEVGAGVMPIVTTTDGEIAMTQPAPRFGARFSAEEAAPLVGLAADDFADTPETVSTGTPFLICRLTSIDALARARRDLDAWTTFKTRPDCDFSDPFLTAPAAPEMGADLFSRLLLTPPEPTEDAFTGSATGCMAAWSWARGRLDAPEFTAAQGDWMGRPGRARVEVLGPPDAIAGVRVSGRAAILFRGEITI